MYRARRRNFPQAGAYIRQKGARGIHCRGSRRLSCRSAPRFKADSAAARPLHFSIGDAGPPHAGRQPFQPPLPLKESPLFTALVTALAFVMSDGLPVKSPKSVGMSAERLESIDRVVRRGIKAGGYPG